MIPKRLKPGLMIVLLSVVLCIVIGDVAGGPTERSTSTKKCGRTRAGNPYSFGGTHTELNAWPWMVALRKELPKNKTAFFCAGSLIAERHVVSGKNEFTPLYSID
jgi:secreted trypsin-like serine protease